MRCGVNACLADSGIDPTDVSRIGNVFTEMVNPFDGLETYHKQEAYFREEFNLLVSIHYHAYLPKINIPLFKSQAYFPSPPLGTT